jgi:hypothetical protein
MIFQITLGMDANSVFSVLDFICVKDLSPFLEAKVGSSSDKDHALKTVFKLIKLRFVISVDA